MRLYILFFVMFLPLNFSQAQLDENFSKKTDILIISENLNPFSNIEAELTDYDATNITWEIDGKKHEEFNNQRTINFTLKNLDQKTTVRAYSTNKNNISSIVEKTITPVYLDVVIEPQTRTPIFYKGRALPSIDSTVNLTALVNGSVLNSDNYIYDWKLNNTSITKGNLNGLYKTSTVVSYGSANDLSLVITKKTGELVAKKYVSIIPVEPEVNFYEISSLYGISHLKINQSLNLVGNSTIIKAEPFYLDIKTFNNPQYIEWKVGNTRSPNNSGDPYELTLNRENLSGSSNVNFHVRNLDYLLQGVEGSLKIN